MVRFYRFLYRTVHNVSYFASLNLNLSTNLPKTMVQSEEIMTIVNTVLAEYYYGAHYKEYMNYYNLHKALFESKKSSAVMHSEKIILCEFNGCLWNKALNSAISTITKLTFPHYTVVQTVINYLLNSSSEENFAVVEEFFFKLLLCYPPGPVMFDYYWQIVSHPFVILSYEKTEERSLIFCLIESITNSLKNGGSEDSKFLKNKTKLKIVDRVNSLRMEELVNFDVTLNKSPAAEVNKKQKFFIDLPNDEKIKRCFLILKFVYNLLETDFIFWLQSEKLQPTFTNTKPLISCLLWPNVRDVGLINKEVHEILDFYDIVESSNLDFPNMIVAKKLVTLLGEVIRCSDHIEEVKYPFVGAKTDNFFRELSVILFQRLKESKKTLKENELIVDFKPSWLKLNLCSNLLSLVTGYQCLPELTGVHDILEHIAHMENKSPSATQTSKKQNEILDSRLLQKLKTFKSINAKLRDGKTLLHKACQEDDTEKIKALLTFPELDVNAADREGWTPLHTASHKGNVTSAKELLSFWPKSRDAQKPVNTRARGPESVTPLMCAVSQGHAKVCQLLLEHSGSVLLEDVNDFNQTPLELSNTSEVTDILLYYQKNNVWTYHSHKDINFGSDLKEVVMRLCVEMIQAYFSTYRTWDVYKSLKQSGDKLAEHQAVSDVDFKWDYMRYQRDIKRNIYKLKRLTSKLQNVKEFDKLSEIYVRILSFNKSG